MTSPLKIALGLALGAAVSLGLSRFSYALMLPPMRADLGWSYFTAGSMNTVNAAGYLVGALMTAGWLRRHAARHLLLWGSGIAGLALFVHGFFIDETVLYALRFVTGVANAASFVAGGVMAARLVGAAPAVPRTAQEARPLSSGLALGIYYGGTGLGIAASALMIPPLIVLRATHGWQLGWFGLGIAALVATALMGLATRGLDTRPQAASAASGFEAKRFASGLVAYFLFGLAYIGYMTFVITLLRESALPSGLVTAFFVVLGVGVCASSWLWARLLQRFRGGEVMTLLCALLVVATLLPVASTHPIAVFASGLLFGAVFVSVVAATTALVRHNVEPSAWPRGIAAFTILFAAGQIVGPALVGAVSDAAGGLRSGFVFSAAVLAIAALVAWRQKPLGP